VRGTLAIEADSAEEIEQIGRVFDVAVEHVTLGVRDELLLQELLPARIEACSIYAEHEIPDRNGPVVRVFIKAAEDSHDSTDADVGRAPRESEGQGEGP
jgi:hypothetical protein